MAWTAARIGARTGATTVATVATIAADGAPEAQLTVRTNYTASPGVRVGCQRVCAGDS